MANSTPTSAHYDLASSMEYLRSSKAEVLAGKYEGYGTDRKVSLSILYYHHTANLSPAERKTLKEMADAAALGVVQNFHTVCADEDGGTGEFRLSITSGDVRLVTQTSKPMSEDPLDVWVTHFINAFDIAQNADRIRGLSAPRATRR